MDALNGVCVIFKCRNEEEIAISDDNLTLLRQGGKVFAALLDGVGGFEPSIDRTMIFQRFDIAASVVGKLVMAANNTLEVDTPNFQEMRDAAERLGGFSFVEDLRRKGVKRPLDDVESLYEWKTVHYSFAKEMLRITEEGFQFVCYEEDCKLYHLRKDKENIIRAVRGKQYHGSIAQSLPR